MFKTVLSLGWSITLLVLINILWVSAHASVEFMLMTERWQRFVLPGCEVGKWDWELSSRERRKTIFGLNDAYPRRNYANSIMNNQIWMGMSAVVKIHKSHITNATIIRLVDVFSSWPKKHSFRNGHEIGIFDATVIGRHGKAFFIVVTLSLLQNLYEGTLLVVIIIKIKIKHLVSQIISSSPHNLCHCVHQKMTD